MSLSLQLVRCARRQRERSIWVRLHITARFEQAPNSDHLCEMSHAKNQQLATPTGVQTRRLLIEAVLNIRQSQVLDHR